MSGKTTFTNYETGWKGPDMELTDEQRIELARKVLLEAAQSVTNANSNLAAVLVVTDGAGIFISPLRLTKEQTFSVLVAACSAVEPENFEDRSGELH